MTNTQQLLSELARAKAAFQLCAITTILGDQRVSVDCSQPVATPPQTLTPQQPKPEHTTKKDNG